ncbi:MAG: septum formation initiator family protein [Clostridia bacterium]|nr:septum formation initiator family protein [Clostridia bacterium]
MLLVILVTILAYQLVGIYSRNNRIKALDAEIATLEAQISSTDDSIKEWSERWKIEQRARELGLMYDDDEE